MTINSFTRQKAIHATARDKGCRNKNDAYNAVKEQIVSSRDNATQNWYPYA